MKLKDLFEARQLGLTYTEKQVKGQVDRVIVELNAKHSEKFTKLGAKYKTLKEQLEDLDTKMKALNAEIKDQFTDYFDAEDEVLTRVIETVSLTLTLTKRSVTTKTEVDYKAVVDGLLEMVPELADKINDLINVHTAVSERVTQSKLNEPKLKEGVSEIWSKIKSFLKSFASKITSWGKGYDRRLKQLQAQLM
jgi:uncharacterized coiled-coil DUF342 family protein